MHLNSSCFFISILEMACILYGALMKLIFDQYMPQHICGILDFIHFLVDIALTPTLLSRSFRKLFIAWCFNYKK